jgi:sigma-B regulation protein RsbU (phosphoserine phosphatase)
VSVGGESAAVLRLAADADEALAAALLQAITAFAEAHFSLTDLSRSLATAWKESNFLHDLTQTLNDIVDVRAAATVIVRQLARVQRQAQVALVLLSPDGPELVACHPEGALAPGAWQDVLAAAGQREPLLRAEPSGGRVALPLVDAERPIGVLVLQGTDALMHAANMKFLQSVGAQIALALRLRYEIQHRIEAAELRRDLALGAEIQRSLLPQAAPRFAGIQLAAECRPAQMVGGDGFDYNEHAGGLDVAIADVSGHGVAAGLLMSSFLGMVRSLDLASLTPAELAEKANRRICREVGLSGQFISAVYARIAPGGRRLRYAMLGHPAPLLWRGESLVPLQAVVGMPAGLAEEARYGEAELALEPGDVLLFYTDGLVEACAPDGEAFGLERLQAAMASAGREPEAVLAAVYGACRAFQGGQPPRDDQTAIALHVIP